MNNILKSNVSANNTESWPYMNPDLVSQRLEMMVAGSAEVCGHAADLSNVMMHSSRLANNRTHAIKWIKEVVSMSEMSMDARDTSIQIFDRFFGRHLLYDPSAFDNSETFSTVAAVSVLLSSKFHESRPLSMSSFSSFTSEVLSAAENNVLVTLEYNIVPLVTPTAFIHQMLLLWPNLEENFNLLSSVTDIACKLIGEFWETAASCQYAPSTIALAALLLAFSSQRIDCSRWLSDCVPDSCLPGAKNIIFPPSGQYLLDIDRCLMDFQRRCCVMNFGIPLTIPSYEKDNAELSRFDSSSPVSIADGFRTTTPVAEAAAMSLSDNNSSPSSPPHPIAVKEDRRIQNKRIKLF